MRKYIMLYNYDLDEYGMELIDAIKTMFPETQIENYCVSRPHGEPEFIHNDFCVSVWLPEEQFLAAWMFVNMYMSETDPKISSECIEDFLLEETIDDGIDYMNKHLIDPELFVRYYEV